MHFSYAHDFLQSIYYCTYCRKRYVHALQTSTELQYIYIYIRISIHIFAGLCIDAREFSFCITSRYETIPSTTSRTCSAVYIVYQYNIISALSEFSLPLTFTVSISLYLSLPSFILSYFISLCISL